MTAEIRAATAANAMAPPAGARRRHRPAEPGRTLAWRHLRPTGGCCHVNLLRPDQVTGLFHDHDFAECLLIVDGKLEHHVNGQCRELSRGLAAVIRPADRHRFVIRQAGGGICMLNVAFPAAELAVARQRLMPTDELIPGHAAPIPPHAWLPDRETDRLMELAGEIVLGGAEERLLFERFLLTFLTAFRHCRTPPDRPPLPGWLATACQQLRTPQYLQLGLPMLWKLCGRSPEHVSRLVRQHWGMTPSELLLELRLEQATRLLQRGSQSVDCVAGECGFRSVGYFHRAFKRRFGLTPRQHRLRQSGLIA